jgi:hypothetical protein
MTWQGERVKRWTVVLSAAVVACPLAGALSRREGDRTRRAGQA